MTPTDETKNLRWLGICGIAGSLVLLLSDWVMLGSPSSGTEFMANWLQILSSMPTWRLTIGGLAGPIGAGLYVLGFYHMYMAIRPAGAIAPCICMAGFSVSFICLASFHAAFPFAAYLHNIHEAAPEVSQVVDENYSRAMVYFGRMYLLGLAPSLLAIVLLPYVILFRSTLYPKWFALANPALFWFGCYVFRYLPAPLGGPLFIGSGNIAFLIFFAMSTWVLWNASYHAAL